MDEPRKLKKDHFNNFFDPSDQSLKLFDHIASGENYSLAVCNNKLFSFGKEDKGRLGLG